MNETTQAEICKAITENSNIRNKRILEVGCGSGRITSHLVKHTLNITAIDPCTASIRSAQNSYPQIEFLVGSGEKTEFKDSTFDAVIFFHFRCIIKTQFWHLKRLKGLSNRQGI